MKRWTWLLCVMAGLVLAVGPVMAADTPKDTKKAEEVKPADTAKKPGEAEKPAVDGEVAVMAKECQLTDDQQKKIMAAITTAQAEIKTWEKTNAEKIEAFKKAMNAAREARDQAAANKAVADAKPLMDENQAMGVKFQKAILDILTPDQQATWQGFLLFNEMSVVLKRVNATEDQMGKLRPLCNATGKELVAVKAENEEAAKARQAIGGKFVENVKAQILTPEQRAQLAPPPGAMPPMGPPAGAPPPAAPKADAPKAPAAK